MIDRSTWICLTCGGHYPGADSPPASCVICEDERQWVPPTGQRWATMAELADAGYRTDIREVEPNLVGIGVHQEIGVNQRGLLVRTPEGNLLWDPPAFLDEQAVQAVRAAGGLRFVSSSHPHMYGAIVDWSDVFDAEITLPEVDIRWLNRPAPAVRPWSDSRHVLPGVTLVRCGGHFPGSAVLHWAEGAGGAGVLLVGDTFFITPGEDRVTFAWSAPNRLPLPERGVRGVVDAVRPYRFDRVYGGWWQPVLRRDAQRIVAASAERYIQFLRGDVPIDG